MNESRTAEQANSFGRAAGEYERARPGYPDQVVDWMLPATAQTVLDLGAGTGKFTRSLVARSYIITASPAGRAATLDAVRKLAASDPALIGRARFGLPYVTHGFRATLPGRPIR